MGSMLTSREANNLAYSFTSTFNSEIGLKFAGESGSFPGLGSVTINTSSISGGKEAETAEASKICQRWGVNMVLNSL